MIRFLFALALAAAPSLAQDTGTLCSDNTVEFVPTHITYGSMAECSGTQFTVGNAQVQPVRNKCPQLVVVTPSHYAPKHSPGCNTDVRVTSQSPILSYTYRCAGDYLLMFRLTAECVLVEKDNIGTIPNHTVVPCARTAVASTIGHTE